MVNTNINGAQLKYYVDGVGEPLVLVHGSASDYRTWQCQRDKFARQFRVITYSRRYHWPNEPIEEEMDYSMNQHVEDLRVLLQSLDGSPAHIVGHSYGAFVSLLLAMRQPLLVRTLILAEPPAITLFVSNHPKPPELLRLMLARPRTAAAIIKLGVMGLGPAEAAAREGDKEEVMRRFGKAALGREAYDGLSESRREQARANLIMAEFLGSGYPPLAVQQVRDIQIPTLLLTGQSSPGAFHLLADRLDELLPHSERQEIPDASHMMHEDNAPAFNSTVLDFLARHRQAVWIS